MLTLRIIARRCPTLFAAAFFTLCLAWSSAADAQYVVTVTTDDGTGGTAGTLSNAILQANATGGTITFSPGVTTVTLTGSMYGISAAAAVTINGGTGVTINANGFQAFTVNSGNVEFQNLTINGGRAQGQAGANGNGGGGGGLGGGGAIYIDPNAGAIGITNVNFTNNQAVGGAGGNGDGVSANGGNGGGYNGNAGPNTAPSGTGGGAGAIGAGDGTAGGYGGGGGGGSTGATTPAPGNGGGAGGLSGQGGGGGLALGGAVFVGNGNTTTIRGGTVIAASNSSTGGAGGTGTTTANNGAPGTPNGGGLYVGVASNAIFDNSTTDITVNGNIFSNGFITIQGGATGVVNFLGTTTISTASNPAANITVSTGTLNGTTNGISGPVVNNSIVRFTQAGLGSFNGQMSGSGRVDIEGGGTVIFDEVNTQTGLSTNTFNYSGATNVNNGLLFLGTNLPLSSVNVAASSGLVGNGTIGANLTNSGVLAPGDGIGLLTVGGVFTSNNGSTTQIQINSGGNTPGTNNDIITVGGNINLDGNVFVQTTGGVYNVGTAYTFITYGGTRTGTFDGATTNSAFLGADIDYSVANQVRLILTRNATNYADVAQTYNQQQVAGYLDANSAGATGDFATVLDNINSLSAAGARSAFDQLGGPIFGTAGRMGIQQTSFMYLMLRRGSRGNEEIGIEEIHADGRIAGEDGAGDETIRLVNDESTTLGGEIVPVIRVNRQRRHTWNAWSTSYGTLSTGIGTGLNSLDGRYGSFGTITSVYRYIDDGLKFGVFGAYNRLNLRLIQPYQSSNSDDYQLGSYLRGDDGTSYFLAASSFGWDNYQSARTISFANIGRQAFGNFDGYQTTGYLELGRKVPMWPIDMEPFLSGQYTYVHQNGFTESGANSINLAVPGIDSNSFRSMLGTRGVIDLITLDGEPLKLEMMAAWMHEYLDANTVIRSTFTGVGGTAFGTEGVNFGRDWLVAGAGLNWAPTANTALAANYDALLNDITNFHLFSASFQLKW